MSSFIVPPRYSSSRNFTNNPVYTIGSQLEVQWNTTRTEYQMTLWQSMRPTGRVAGFVEYAKEPEDIQTGLSSFNWTVNAQNFNLSVSNVFFFACGNVSSSLDRAFISHKFNLTEASAESTSSSVSIVSTTTTRSLSSATTSPSSPTLSLAQQSPSSTAITTGVDSTQSLAQTQSRFVNLGIGLGVGLGVGIPLLLAVLFLFYLRYRKRHPQPHNHSSIQKHIDARTSPYSMSENDMPIARPSGQVHVQSELEARQQTVRYEKDGAGVRTLTGVRGGEVAELSGKSV